MKVKNIRIRNLKSVGYVDIHFDEDSSRKDVFLLYGDNGVGKTTILEAISLLGHLSTMYRISVKPGKQVLLNCDDSRFIEALKAGDMFCVANSEIIKIKSNANNGAFPSECNASRQQAGGPQPRRQHSENIPAGDVEDSNKKDAFGELNNTLKDKAKNGLEEWFKGCELSDGAIISFRINFGFRKGFKDDVTLYIYFDKTQELSITQALGRKKCDDVMMNGLFAMLWEMDKSVDAQIGQALDCLIKECPHMIGASLGCLQFENNKYLEELKNAGLIGGYSSTYIVLKHTSRINPVNRCDDSDIGYTFYLNTDLNDFGRMMDVRESVKDIESDFVEEWINRLGIRVDKHKPDVLTFPYQDKLEQLIGDTISHSSPFFSFKDIASRISVFGKVKSQAKKAIRFKTLSIIGGRIVIEISRGEDEQTRRIDYLSAGENEVFFIFMYLLGMNVTNSICLFDEPDLHLAEFSKRPFFRELFKLLLSNGCQVILATHSGFAYVKPRSTTRFLIRKNRLKKERETNQGSNQGAKLDHRFTHWFMIKLAYHYWRTAAGVLGISGGIYAFTLFAVGIFGHFSLISDLVTGLEAHDPKKHYDILIWISKGVVCFVTLLLHTALIVDIKQGIINSED